MAHRGTGHWDGSYGTESGLATTIPFENHQDRVYGGPSQHHLKEHSYASSKGAFGDCSAEEMSEAADEYLRLIPDGKSRPRSP